MGKQRQGEEGPPLDQRYREQVDTLDAFFKTRADDPESVERLRQSYCDACCATPEAERDESCFRRRCGLRNPRWLRGEQEFIFGTIFDVWLGPRQVREQALARLNEHVAMAGCATTGLWQDPAGYYRTMINGNNLRALVHGATVRSLAFRLGDRLSFNLDNYKQGEAVDLVERHYSQWREDKRQQAEVLRRTGMPDQEIARLLNTSARSLRGWLGPRADWPFPEELPETTVTPGKNGTIPQGDGEK